MEIPSRGAWLLWGRWDNKCTQDKAVCTRRSGKRLKQRKATEAGIYRGRLPEGGGM